MHAPGWLQSREPRHGERYGVAGTVTTWDVGSIRNVVSFGEDGAGELYMLSSNGRVYRITRK